MASEKDVSEDDQLHKAEGAAPNEYRVGYGKPPLHGRIRKGEVRNPRGRGKGRPNIRTLVRNRLFGRISITEGGKTRRMTRLEAIIARATNAALEGKSKGFDQAITLMRIAGLTSEDEGPSSASSPLTAAEQAIIDEFLASQKGGEG